MLVLGLWQSLKFVSAVVSQEKKVRDDLCQQPATFDNPEVTVMGQVSI